MIQESLHVLKMIQLSVNIENSTLWKNHDSQSILLCIPVVHWEPTFGLNITC